MKYFSYFLACAMTVFLVFGAGPAFAVDDYSLLLESWDESGSTEKSDFLPNETFLVHILAANSGGNVKVAGAAFTLEYPADLLDGPATDEDGVVTGTLSIDSSFPFTFSTDVISETETHRENAVITPTAGIKIIRFAGAAIDTNEGENKGGALIRSSPQVLFTVQFKVKNGAASGSFDMVLKQTMLFNPDAGYGTEGDVDETPESVSALVGAIAQEQGRKDPSADFPVLLDSFGPITNTLYVDDEDNIDNAWEEFWFDDLVTADNTSDWDNDGYLDRYEQTSENNTNPMEQDAPFGPNYDASTDNRGPYQVITTDPTAPRAEAGESFELAVEYDTTDDNNSLDGLSLTLHYNSNDLTFDGFDSIIGADTVVTATDTSIAADSVITVTWTGNANWTGGTLPATLYNATFTSDVGLADAYQSQLWYTGTPDDGYILYSEPITYTVGPTFTLDVDGDGDVDSMTDGIMLERYELLTQMGMLTPGWSLNLFSVAGDRNTEAAVEEYLDSALAADLLDIDGDGDVDSMTDGIMLERYELLTQMGMLTPGWSLNLFNTNGTRGTENDVQTYLDTLMP